jgi:hypothetical protein
MITDFVLWVKNLEVFKYTIKILSFMGEIRAFAKLFSQKITYSAKIKFGMRTKLILENYKCRKLFS